MFSNMDDCEACRSLLWELRSKGNDAFVIALDFGAREKKWSDDNTTLFLSSCDALLDMPDLGLDVVHCCSLKDMGEFAHTYAEAMDIPMVCSCDGTCALHVSFLTKECVMAAIASDAEVARVIEKNHVMRHLVAIPKEESVVVYAEKVTDVYRQAILDYAARAKIETIVPNGTHLVVGTSVFGKQVQSIAVSLDDYAQLKLKKGRRLVPQELDYLIGRQSGIGAYEKCLRKISCRDHSEKEVREWLKKDYPQDVAESVIARLKREGYIDDEKYCRTQVELLGKALWGRKQIVRQLMEKGIASNVIELVIKETELDGYGNAYKVGEKVLKAHGNGSLRKTQDKIRKKLAGRGYESEEIENALESLDYGETELREKKNLKKCAEKAMKRYGRKLSGAALWNKVFQYCMMQGYGTDDIGIVLEELKYNEEN